MPCLERISMPVPVSSLKKLKAVIFDLDGVIVDSEKSHFDTFNQALAHFGIRLTRRYWKTACTGIGSYAIMEGVFRRNRISEDVRKWVEKRAALYQGYVEKNGLPGIGGFLDFYRFLKVHKIKVAVASGGHKRHIAASLRAIGLPGIPFVGLEDVKRGKPSPDLFLLAAKKLHVKPSECIAFEDSLAGVGAVFRAGMPCIALSTTVSRKALLGKAALIVGDFRPSALKKLMLRLVSGR